MLILAIEQKFPGIYIAGGKIATRSMAPGTRVYGERIVRDSTGEYRIWDLYRSKLAGAIKKGLAGLEIVPGAKVLYLGAATGTTASHVADVVGENGELYCVEFAQRSMRDLIAVCEKRPNMMPIHADANNPSEYADAGEVDVVYQDVSQPNQSEILIKNCDMFLKKGGIAYMCVKSQSIDVTLPPRKVFEMVKKQLEGHFEIEQEIELAPYDLDHLFLALRKK
ncbi:MAG: fibrillarin-like rRNA/tRNA 2'-O-methyltransferase [Candidatus Micrarchaeia archaeon]